MQQLLYGQYQMNQKRQTHNNSYKYYIAKKSYTTKVIPYSVVEVVLVLGLGVFIKLGTGEGQSEVLGVNSVQMLNGGNSTSLSDRIRSFFGRKKNKTNIPPNQIQNLRNKTEDKLQKIKNSRKQKPSDWIFEIDDSEDDEFSSDIDDLYNDLNEL